MRDVVHLLFELLTTISRLLRPGGSRTVIAENLLLKQQLIIHCRSRQRAPNLTTRDRTLLGFLSLFLEVINAVVEMKRRNPRYGCPRIAQQINLAFGLGLDKDTVRILDIAEIKSIPYAPMSHPFIERLIGSVRRELLDRTFFWTATDLEKKLRTYEQYYNEYRCHSSRYGTTPVESFDKKTVDIGHYRWKKHCRGLFQLPIAA